MFIPSHDRAAWRPRMTRRRRQNPSFPARDFYRPWLELLEERVLLANIFWNVDASGFWDTASNWSGGSVPGSGDDVVIDRPAGDFTVTVRSGSQSVQSLQSTEKLALTGGS